MKITSCNVLQRVFFSFGEHKIEKNYKTKRWLFFFFTSRNAQISPLHLCSILWPHIILPNSNGINAIHNLNWTSMDIRMYTDYYAFSMLLGPTSTIFSIDHFILTPFSSFYILFLVCCSNCYCYCCCYRRILVAYFCSHCMQTRTSFWFIVFIDFKMSCVRALPTNTITTHFQ